MRQRAARVAVEAQPGGDLLSRGQVDAVGEHRQVPEQPPLFVGQQLVGPFHGRAQRAVPRLAVGRPPPSRSSARSSRGGELGEGERRQPPGGQLDGQRHPVEPSHDLGDERAARPGGGEPGPDPRGAVEKHRDGRDAGQRLGRRARRPAAGAAPGATRTQRPARAARGWWPARELGTRVEDHGDEVAHGVDQVLAVVDDEQPRPTRRGLAAQAASTSPCTYPQPERRGQRVRDRAAASVIGASSSTVAASAASGELPRDAASCRPRRSDDRDQPLGVEQPLQRGRAPGPSAG